MPIDIIRCQKWHSNCKFPMFLENVNLFSKKMPGYLKILGWLVFLSSGLSKISIHCIEQCKIEIMICQEWSSNFRPIFKKHMSAYFKISGLWLLLCSIACSSKPTKQIRRRRKIVDLSLYKNQFSGMPFWLKNFPTAFWN